MVIDGVEIGGFANIPTYNKFIVMSEIIHQNAENLIFVWWIRK